MHELANCVTRELRWHFLILQQNIYQRCKQKIKRSTVKYFIVPVFPLNGNNNYVVEEFSAERQRAIISWDHYLAT